MARIRRIGSSENSSQTRAIGHPAAELARLARAGCAPAPSRRVGDSGHSRGTLGEPVPEPRADGAGR